MTKKKPDFKRKFKLFEMQKNNFTHFHVSKYLTEEMKYKIYFVNNKVRNGVTYKEIAKMLDIGQTEVKWLHYGCCTKYLTDMAKHEHWEMYPNTGYKYKLCRKYLRKAALDIFLPKLKETDFKEEQVLLYTKEKVIQLEEHELTDAMPMPFRLEFYDVCAVNEYPKLASGYEYPNVPKQGDPDVPPNCDPSRFRWELRNVYTSWWRWKYVMKNIVAMYHGAHCRI